MPELMRVTPDGRRNGSYQWATAYNGGFSFAYTHLTFDEVAERLMRHYPDTEAHLIDDGVDLVLVSTIPEKPGGSR